MTGRAPFSSGAPTQTWTTAAEFSVRTRGLARVSSSTRSQPTWSPARTASSRKAGGGEGCHAADGVVHQPGVGLGGEASGEQDAVRSGQGDGGAEQRVFGGDQARGADVAGGGHEHRPVALVLPGVGGQVGAAGPGAVEAGGPVDVDAGRVQPGQRGEQAAFFGAVLAQCRHGQRAGVGVGAGVEALLGEGGEDAVGSQFDEGVRSGVGEGAYSVGEADGGADVVHPVLGGAEPVLVVEGAGDVGDDREERLVVGEALGDAAELREHRLHQRRVEGVTDRQPLGLTAPGDERGGQGQDFALLAGQDDGFRAVDRAQGDPRRQQRRDLGLGRLHRDHRPTRRQLLHQPGPSRHQRTRVLQREHPRHMRGSDLTHGMPRDELRRDTPRLHQAVEGDLEGEQGGLGVAGAVEEGRLGGAAPGEQDVAQRPVQVRVQQGARLVEGGREHREAGVQFASHAGALGALAGEQHGEGACGGVAPGRFGGGAVDAGEQDGTVLEGGAPGGQGGRCRGGWRR